MSPDITRPNEPNKRSPGNGHYAKTPKGLTERDQTPTHSGHPQVKTDIHHCYVTTDTPATAQARRSCPTSGRDRGHHRLDRDRRVYQQPAGLWSGRRRTSSGDSHRVHRAASRVVPPDRTSRLRLQRALPPAGPRQIVTTILCADVKLSSRHSTTWSRHFAGTAPRRSQSGPRTRRVLEGRGHLVSACQPIAAWSSLPHRQRPESASAGTVSRVNPALLLFGVVGVEERLVEVMTTPLDSI